MGMHEKQIEFNDDLRALLDIPDGEPFFILRAQDAASVDTLLFYEQRAIDEDTSPEFRESLENVITRWQDWQAGNSDKIKAAD